MLQNSTADLAANLEAFVSFVKGQPVGSIMLYN